MQRRFLPFILLIFLAAFALSAPLDEYFSLLKSGKYLEFRGKIVGFLKSKNAVTLILDDGETNCLKFKEFPSPIEIGKEVRLLAKLSQEEGIYEFIVMVNEGEARAKEEAQSKETKGQTFYFPIPASRGNLTSRGNAFPFTISEEIIEAYKKAVLYFNPRLDDNSARLIAQAILYFGVANNLDPRLVVAVIAVESGFDPKAVSPKGAMGLGQLMPKTAAGMGVKNPFDPLENISAAIRLIRGHLEKFEGDPQQLALALASYNAGSGAVKKYNGIPPYKETQAYIDKVTSLYKKICGY